MLLLLGCVLCLLAVGTAGIIVPLHFEKRVADREEAVRSHLEEIISAEERYQADKGRYTSHFGDLIGGGYLADSLCVRRRRPAHPDGRLQRPVPPIPGRARQPIGGASYR